MNLTDVILIPLYHRQKVLDILSAYVFDPINPILSQAIEPENIGVNKVEQQLRSLRWQPASPRTKYSVPGRFLVAEKGVEASVAWDIRANVCRDHERDEIPSRPLNIVDLCSTLCRAVEGMSYVKRRWDRLS